MIKQKVLLHICCAPCSAGAVKELADDFDISFYWYNPNIYDEPEYNNRKNSAAKYASFLGFEFFEEEDFLYDWKEWKNKSLLKCENCYALRLEKAASFAKKNNFAFFSTSLLSSPYQNHDLIKKYAFDFAAQYGTGFLYRDFRPYFYEGKNILKKEGYYIQKYCGCFKSYEERFLNAKK
jgi:predicted adenine nucleotide alpha hydrolase (AANH) superfamily ATPase